MDSQQRQIFRTSLVLIAVIGTGGGVCTFNYSLPDPWVHSHTAQIEAPPAEIFAIVSTASGWIAWSEWVRVAEPTSMLVHSDGPPSGVGMELTWSSEKRKGAGTVVITEALRNQRVRYDLSIGAHTYAHGELGIEPTDAGSALTWSETTLGVDWPGLRLISWAMNAPVDARYAHGLGFLSDLATDPSGWDAKAFAWPDPQVDGLPGWLALRAQPGPERTSSARFVHADAPVISQASGWAAVPKGTEVRALSSAGPTTLRFEGVQALRHGCDGGHEESVALFSGQAEGTWFWLLGPNDQAEVLPVVDGDSTDASLAWGTGEQSHSLTRDGTEVSWVVGDTTVHTYAMGQRQGVSDVEVAGPRGVFQPADLAIAFSDGPTAAPISWRAAEGDHFDLALVDADGTRWINMSYLYDCAQ